MKSNTYLGRRIIMTDIIKIPNSEIAPSEEINETALMELADG